VLVDGQAVLLHALLVAEIAVVGVGHDEILGHVADLRVARAAEARDHAAHHVEIVGADRVDRAAGHPAVAQHDGHAPRRVEDLLFVVRRAAEEDEALDIALDEASDVARLGLVVVAQAADHDRVVVPPRLVEDRLHALRVELVREVGDEHRDEPLAAVERRRGARDVAEARHGLVHAQNGVLRDAGRLVDDVRDRRDRDAGPFRHVLHRHGLPPAFAHAAFPPRVISFLHDTITVRIIQIFLTGCNFPRHVL